MVDLVDLVDLCKGSGSAARKDPLEISLSWHFSVLMLALQGEDGRTKWRKDVIGRWKSLSTVDGVLPPCWKVMSRLYIHHVH